MRCITDKMLCHARIDFIYLSNQVPGELPFPHWIPQVHQTLFHTCPPWHVVLTFNTSPTLRSRLGCTSYCEATQQHCTVACVLRSTRPRRNCLRRMWTRAGVYIHSHEYTHTYTYTYSIYIYKYIYIHIYIYMYTHMYIHMHVCICKYISIHIYIHIHIHIHMCICIYLYMNIYVQTYTYIYIYIHIRMYIYICTYTRLYVRVFALVCVCVLRVCRLALFSTITRRFLPRATTARNLETSLCSYVTTSHVCTDPVFT